MEQKEKQGEKRKRKETPMKKLFQRSKENQRTIKKQKHVFFLGIKNARKRQTRKKSKGNM